MKDLIVVGAVFHRFVANQVEILAFQRSLHDTSGGRWEFPGGKIEPSEAPSQAILREMSEETGVDCRIQYDLGREFPADNGFRTTHFPTRSVVLRVFVMQPKSWDFTLPDHQALVWVNEEQAKHIDWLEGDLPWLKDVFSFLRMHYAEQNG